MQFRQLDICSIDLDSTRCPLCDDDLETAQHIFVDCSFAINIWNQVTYGLVGRG